MILTSREKTGFRLKKFRSSEVAGLSYNDRQCVQFGGIDQYVQCSNGGDWERGDPFSVSAWIRTTYVAAGRGIIQRAQSAGPNIGWFFNLNSLGYLSYTEWDTDSKFTIVRTTTATANDGDWHHVLVSSDGSDGTGINFYIDGNPQNKNIIFNQAVNSIRTADPPQIGVANPFRGQIRQVALWSKELSTAEINQLLSGRSATDLRELTFFDNCDAWWRMGAIAHDIYPNIRDWSGNENHASMVNMTQNDIVPLNTTLP